MTCSGSQIMTYPSKLKRSNTLSCLDYFSDLFPKTPFILFLTILIMISTKISFNIQSITINPGGNSPFGGNMHVPLEFSNHDPHLGSLSCQKTILG